MSYQKNSYSPIELKITPAYEVVASGGMSRFSVLVEVRALSAPTSQKRSPVTIDLCLDTSTSMQGSRLELVKYSVRQLLKQLNSDDRVGLVSFNDVAKRWLLPGTLYEGTRRYLLECIDALYATGWTAMYDGLEESLRGMAVQRAEAGDQQDVRRIFLLTDGDPTIGRCSEADIAGVARELRGDTVVSTFGYGSDHREDLMRAVATAGGGSYTYIDCEESAPTAFAMELGAMFRVVARDAKLLLQPQPGCSLTRLYGDNDLRHSSRGLELKLSDLSEGQSIALLMDLEIDSSYGDMSMADLMHIGVEFCTPDADYPTLVQQSLSLPRSTDMPENTHPRVARQQLLMWVAECRKEAHACSDQGLYMEAIKRVDPCIKALKQHPEWDDGLSEIRDWYEQLVDERDFFLQTPSRQDYDLFRKVAIAEMAIPGQALGNAQGATRMAASPTQRALIDQFYEDADTRAWFHVQEKGGSSMAVPINQEVTIGRVQGNDIVLPKGNVSKRQVKVVQKDGKVIVVDLKSSNGTYVNGYKIGSPQVMNPGDKLFVGDFVLTLHIEPKDQPEPGSPYCHDMQPVSGEIKTADLA